MKAGLFRDLKKRRGGRNHIYIYTTIWLIAFQIQGGYYLNSIRGEN